MSDALMNHRLLEGCVAVRLGRRRLLAAGAALLMSRTAAFGEDVALLTVYSGEGERVFGRAELEGLPQHSFTTSTIWTAGRPTFSGPPLVDVLSSARISQGSVELVAINDYRVSINLEDLAERVPILATRIDGRPFSRREKGPLWLVYPYDHDPAFRSETIYARSIWQVIRIEVSGT
jgi:hypothetical protein